MDSYERHWAPDAPLLAGREAAELANVSWRRSSNKVPVLGPVSELRVEGDAVEQESEDSASIVSRIGSTVVLGLILSGQYNARLMTKLKTRMATTPRGTAALLLILRQS